MSAKPGPSQFLSIPERGISSSTTIKCARNWRALAYALWEKIHYWMSL